MATNTNYANAVANTNGDVTPTAEPEEHQGHVHHVSVKIPRFNHYNVCRWIGQVESQFTIARITSPATKFAYLHGSLPEDIVNKLSDAAANGCDYQALKTELINTFTESKPELFEKLINQQKFLDQKPSFYLRSLQHVASQLGVGDEIIRIKFLKGMPDDIRSTLVAYDGGTLEELARVADTLLAYKPSSLPLHNITSQKLGPVDQYRFNDTPTTPQISYHQEDTHAHINYVPTQTNKHKYQHDFSGRAQQKTESRGLYNNRPGLQPFYEDQKQKTCRHHIFYGPTARNCKSWCWLKNSNPELVILPNSRPASRSNSPHRSTIPSPAPRNSLNLSFPRSEN
jgi:hypothetical protein